MYRTILSLSLAMLGITNAFSETPYPSPDFKLEIGASYVEHIPTVSESPLTANTNTYSGLCAELHLLYNFKEGHTVSIGTNLYGHYTDFSYPIPSDNVANSYLHYTYSSDVIAIPMSYTIDLTLTPRMDYFVEGGLSLNIPINYTYEQSNYTSSDNSTNITFTSPDTRDLAMTAFVKLGLKTLDHNGYYFKLSGVINQPIKKANLGKVEYTASNPNHPNNQTLSSAFGYYGLSLDLVFSLKKMRKKSKDQ